MKFPILASLIIFAIFLSFAVKRNNQNNQKKMDEFWAREHKANSIRKKPLDNLKYITIPLEGFPTNLITDNPTVLECIDTISNLTSEKIVNLTGYTNTDLKLEYGTSNITQLSIYDQNYTILVRTIQKWADILLEKGYTKEATLLMEYALSTGTDISNTYYTLAQIYEQNKDYASIDKLIACAENLKSANKTVILKKLKDQFPQLI